MGVRCVRWRIDGQRRRTKDAAVTLAPWRWQAYALHRTGKDTTFVEVALPTGLERLIILVAQWIFHVGFFRLCLVSRRTAHRLVGYFEEEAVLSYTQYLQEIDAGRSPNGAAPSIARRYRWKPADDATLRDVVRVVRADEAHHREVNHGLADRLAGEPADPAPVAPYPELADAAR